jgi:hydrogenase nickel incorporation protein HypA/HybF
MPMHEMSLAESVRRIVEEAVADRELPRVKAVVLEIGKLSSVEVDALRFCLDVVLRDSVADGARIEVEMVPGAGWCMQCAETVPLERLYDPCPHCGSYQVQASGGTEMRVRELELE